MKVTIVVFITLIVGSNSDLLGNLLSPAQRALDANTATTKAQELLNFLLSEIKPITTAAIENFSQQVQTAEQYYQTSLNEVITAVHPQLSVSDAVELVTVATQALADLGTNTTAIIAQTVAVINDLSVQIVTKVSPSIQELGSGILSGKLALKCFNDKIPDIRANIIQFVNGTREGFEETVNDTRTVINHNIENLRNITTYTLKYFEAADQYVVSLNLLEISNFD